MNKQLLFLVSVLVIFLAGCEQKEATPTQPQKPYFKGTLNGVFYSLQAEDIYNLGLGTGASIYNASDGNKGSKTGSDTTQMTFSSKVSTLQGEGVGITFINNLPNQQLSSLSNSQGYVLSSQAHFEKLFAVGAYPYWDELTSSSTSGIIISYLDAQGVYWTTAKHPDSEENTFQIIESTKYHALSGGNNNTLQTVKMKFTCKLYNEKGDSLLLKEGEFLGFYENYFTKK